MSENCAVGEAYYFVYDQATAWLLPQKLIQGSGSQPQCAVAISNLAWHVTRPLWATYLACPCLLAFAVPAVTGSISTCFLLRTLLVWLCSRSRTSHRPCFNARFGWWWLGVAQPALAVRSPRAIEPIISALMPHDSPI
jgi:hypothetical protein